MPSGSPTGKLMILKKRWYDLRIITKKKLAAHRKEAAATGGGRNRVPRLTAIEELVESTLEPESIHGIGDADSTARAAKKQGESSRSTAMDSEKRREEAGPSTVQRGKNTEQAAKTPEQTTTPQPQSPLLFGTQESVAAAQSPTQTTPSSVQERARRLDVPPLRILETSEEEEEEGDMASNPPESANAEQQPTPRAVRASVRVRRARERAEEQDFEGVFCGLEATMVKVQRLQAKAMMGVQRQVRTINNKLDNIDKGIREHFGQHAVAGKWHDRHDPVHNSPVRQIGQGPLGEAQGSCGLAPADQSIKPLCNCNLPAVQTVSNDAGCNCALLHRFSYGDGQSDLCHGADAYATDSH
ncbi:uncharacterized protein LOC144785001 [Lissotriton helveticus]